MMAKWSIKTQERRDILHTCLVPPFWKIDPAAESPQKGSWCEYAVYSSYDVGFDNGIHPLSEPSKEAINDGTPQNKDKFFKKIK